MFVLGIIKAVLNLLYKFILYLPLSSLFGIRPINIYLGQKAPKGWRMGFVQFLGLSFKMLILNCATKSNFCFNLRNLLYYWIWYWKFNWEIAFLDYILFKNYSTEAIFDSLYAVEEKHNISWKLITAWDIYFKEYPLSFE